MLDPRHGAHAYWVLTQARPTPPEPRNKDRVPEPVPVDADDALMHELEVREFLASFGPDDF